MKHIDRLYFGGVAVTILCMIWTMFISKIMLIIVGTLVSCYIAGYVLDRFGVIDKILGRWCLCLNGFILV